MCAAEMLHTLLTQLFECYLHAWFQFIVFAMQLDKFTLHYCHSLIVKYVTHLWVCIMMQKKGKGREREVEKREGREERERKRGGERGREREPMIKESH